MQALMLAPIDRRRQRRHKLRNAAQSALLLGGMVALLAACGWIVAGGEGLVWTGLFGAIAMILSARLSSRLVIRLFGAQPLSAAELPEVHQIVHELARRAGIAPPPRLFFISSPTMNAFTMGNRAGAAMALTGGLLRRLSLRELAGVLAHEISHIRHNDTWIMGLADAISRLTRTMSLIGVLLVALNLPLMLTGAGQVPWLLALALVAAPTIGSLLQLALSRTREFDADLDAAGLTGDPAGLAQALTKLQRYQGRFWEDIVLPGRRIPDPSLLRTHPATEERVRRLLELRDLPPVAPLPRMRDTVHHHGAVPPTPAKPRWRRSGLWY